MSKRAEERALKAYPDSHPDFIEINIPRFVKVDRRHAYIEGYDQAEKDLALTCEDIQLIVRLSEEVMTEAGGTPKDYNEEILRRFNETKSKK